MTNNVGFTFSVGGTTTKFTIKRATLYQGPFGVEPTWT